MSKQTITPGEWGILPDDSDTNEECQMVVSRHKSAEHPEIIASEIYFTANAQAIAAVPDMIEALLKIRRIESGNIDGESWALADAALRKAGQIE